jgi:arylsulfatase A-like enzyme
VNEQEYLTDAIGREAVGFIERHKSEPFFLYVPFNAVHQPQEAPKKYLDRFAGEKDEKRRYLLAMLSAEDDGVGRILETLRKNGLEENTIVWFFSDNGGPTFGNGSRNTPLSGYKGQVWEGGIREPFMVQWKGRIPAGKVLEQPVISFDIFATSVAAVGGTMPSDRPMDGVDIMPLLMGKTEARPHEALYWRFGPQWAIRDGDWKMVHVDGFGEKLFDLKSDVGEKKDVSGQHADVASKLRGEFEAWNTQLVKPKWKNKEKFERGLAQIAKQGSMKGKDKEDGE